MADPKKPDDNTPDDPIEIVVDDYSWLNDAFNSPAVNQAVEMLEALNTGETASALAATANLKSRIPSIRFVTRRGGSSEPQAPPEAIASAEAPKAVGVTTSPALATPDKQEAPTPERLIAVRKAARDQRLWAAQERWLPIAHRLIPFAWVRKAADVDHHDGVYWKNGKLPDSSVMSERIEAELLKPDPPPKPDSH